MLKLSNLALTHVLVLIQVVSLRSTRQTNYDNIKQK